MAADLDDQAGKRAGAVKDSVLKRITIDSNVMDKNIVHPTDARLYETAQNKLVGSLKDNFGWGTAARHHNMNHFMARIIFCFFAEDTDIFTGGNLFTTTVDQV